MRKKKLIIIGATGQSVILEEFLILEYEVIGIYDRNKNLKPPFRGVKLFNNEEEFVGTYINEREEISFIVAIGGNNGAERVRFYNKYKSLGFSPITAIHPKSVIASNATIGEGSQILINSTVCARVNIGISAIINSSASVDHDCIIGNGAHIGPGATLAGNVNVGYNSFVGAGATVLPWITIGSHTTIGAGAVVTKNIPSNSVAIGVPARIINNFPEY